ncbi:Flp pilus assembly protein TadG [Catenulispora sp. GP43]|uniref:TadE/TadG family type IV pilus assembly protein n=1 Tax=Catenulispora sp. GP43 TaxID=3156263 RepID=UPI0035191EEA
MTMRRSFLSDRWSTRLSRWRAVACQDEGSGPISTAIVFPVMLGLVFVGVQLAMDYWVHAVAVSAAREGAHAGAAYGKTPEDGVAVARTKLQQLAGNGVTDMAVDPQGSNATQVQINISGNAASLWPFGPGPKFQVTVTVPVERFVAGGAP